MVTPLEKWIFEEAGIEDKSREALEKYQLNKINEIISHSKKGIFYKKHFADIGSVKSFEEFQKLPFTTPMDIIDNPNDFLCVPQKSVSRIVTLKTSGTTSESGKRIFFTEKDLDLTIDFFVHGFSDMLNENDRVMIMMPGDMYGSVGDVIKKSLDKINVKGFIYGVLKDADDAERFIIENSINSIVAIPMQVLYLSEVKKDSFIKYIRKLMLSADYVPEALIERLKNKYGCTVFTHYGLTETGFGCAVECNCLDGYHIRENDMYLEIIDPITGKALEDENWGEIVITTLKREAMPLIRYRTGDWGAFKSKKCKCNTFLRTLYRSRGRIENRLMLGETKYICHSEIDEVILACNGVLDYKVNKTSETNIDISLYLAEYFIDTDNLKKTIKSLFEINNEINCNIIINKYNNIVFSKNTMEKRKILTANK